MSCWTTRTLLLLWSLLSLRGASRDEGKRAVGDLMRRGRHDPDRRGAHHQRSTGMWPAHVRWDGIMRCQPLQVPHGGFDDDGASLEASLEYRDLVEAFQ